MPTSQEVESIFVRLTGDGTQYQQTMKQAEQSTKEFGLTTKIVQQDVDGFGRTMSRFGEAVVAGVGLSLLKGFLEESLQAWAEQEAAIIKTNAILDANGRVVEELSDDYMSFSSEMQRLTTMADEVTLGILAQAESFGLTGDAAKEATAAAIGLAAINDGNAASYLRFTAAFVRGDVQMMKMMSRMIPQLRGIKDETELMAKAQLLVNSGFELAQKQAETYTGQLQQLSNAWGDIKEDIGETIEKVLMPFVKLIRQGVDWIQSLSKETKQFATILMLVVVGISSIGPLVATAGATIIPMLRMMADGFQVAWLAVKLLVAPMTVLSAIGTAIGFVFSTAFLPIVAAIALAALAVAVFVNKMGGLKKTLDKLGEWAKIGWEKVQVWAIRAWDTTKVKAEQFWSWFRPIWYAFEDLMVTTWNFVGEIATQVWNLVVEGAVFVWNNIKTVWAAISNSTDLTWTHIRDAIRDTFIFAEFVLINFKTTADLVWESFRVGWLFAVDQFRGGLRLIITAAVSGARTIARAFSAAWTVMTERTVESARNAIANIGLAANEFARDIVATMAANTSPETQAAAEQLRAHLAAYGQAFMNFRSQRINQMRVTPEEEIAAEIAGRQIGQHFERGFAQPLARIDAALFGSMEAVSRFLEYRQRVLQPSDRPTPALGGERAEAVNPLLRRIATATERAAARPPVEVEGAGLS